ncbi:MAG TPA: ubiquinol-cytochrome c reductase iron-sulfur subunit [bacterium]|nr:ubiquinol-cytochrome c reductase iron-sulfur subunit [bacterium]
MTAKTNPPESRKPASPELLSRRAFLERVTFILGGIGTLAMSVPLVGYVLAPVFKNDVPKWRPVGKVGDFKVGETVAISFDNAAPLPWDGQTGKTGAWLRRNSETEFIAFALTCTHLGCPVRWMASAELFMCPCHGGVYYKDGSVAAGPPPKPLPRFETRINNGVVEVKTQPVAIQRS